MTLRPLVKRGSHELPQARDRQASRPPRRAGEEQAALAQSKSGAFVGPVSALASPLSVALVIIPSAEGVRVPSRTRGGRRAARVIRSNALFRYGVGSECDRFEARYTKYLGVNHFALAASGNALAAAMTPVGLGPGGLGPLQPDELRRRRVDRSLRFSRRQSPSSRRADIDFVIESPWGRKMDAETAYRQMFAAIPEGLTCLSLHFKAPGDFEAVEPDQAYIRTEEYVAFESGLVQELVAAHAVEVIDMREIRDRLRAARHDQ